VVQEHAQVPIAILRPAAVYGPRDGDFLLMFKAARARWLPSFGRWPQQFESACVRRGCGARLLAGLERPAIENRNLHVAHAEVLNGACADGGDRPPLGVDTIQIPCRHRSYGRCAGRRNDRRA